MRGVHRTLLGSAAIAGSFFVAAEIGLRKAGFTYFDAQERGVIWSRVEDPTLRARTGLHEIDAHGMWRPRPGAPIPWTAGETVNAVGLRGPLLEVEKHAGVLRIATLGDGATFGAGVDWQDTYSARLREALAAQGIQAEVLCAGVIDSTVRQGLEIYRDTLRAWHPDLVVCAYDGKSELREAPQTCCDDERILCLCGPFRAAPVARERGFSDRLRGELRIAHVLDWLDDIRRGTYWRERFDTLNEQRLAGRADTFDVAGVRRMSYVEFLNCIVTLAREVEADRGHLMLLSIPNQAAMSASSPVLELYMNVLAETARGEDLVLVSGRSVLAGSLGADLPLATFFQDGGAPSECAHAALAQALADEIVPRIEEYQR